jgi:hypothetical protein
MPPPPVPAFGIATWPSTVILATALFVLEDSVVEIDIFETWG